MACQGRAIAAILEAESQCCLGGLPSDGGHLGPLFGRRMGPHRIPIEKTVGADGSSGLPLDDRKPCYPRELRPRPISAERRISRP